MQNPCWIFRDVVFCSSLATRYICYTPPRALPRYKSPRTSLLTITNNFRGLLDSNYGPHTYVYMSDRWDSLNGTGYWMVGPVDDLSDESFLEDAARSYNMEQVARLVRRNVRWCTFEYF